MGLFEIYYWSLLENMPPNPHAPVQNLYFRQFGTLATDVDQSAVKKKMNTYKSIDIWIDIHGYTNTDTRIY